MRFFKPGLMFCSSLIVLSSVAVSSCAWKAEEKAISSKQQARTIEIDLKNLETLKQGEKLAEPVGLYEAMARALKFNLRSRVDLLEYGLSHGVNNALSASVLPDLAESSGYFNQDQQEKLSLSSLVEKEKAMNLANTASNIYSSSDLKKAWGVLDFGVSYFKSKNISQKKVLFLEQKRMAVQNLVQEVRASYWRALFAERRKEKIENLTTRITAWLDDMAIEEKKGVKFDTSKLKQRLDLIEARQELLNYKGSLEYEKMYLAQLMGAKSNALYTLKGPKEGDLHVPKIRQQIGELEWEALMNRPSMRKLVNLHPADLSDDEYDVGNLLPDPGRSWSAQAVDMAWKLVGYGKILQKEKELEKRKEEKAIKKANEDDLRRRALVKAIISQIHIARKNYTVSLDKYEQAENLYSASMSYSKQMTKDVFQDKVKEYDLIKAKAKSLITGIERDMAFADLQEAAGQLYLSIGRDPIRGSLESMDLPVLAKKLEESMSDWGLEKSNVPVAAPRLPVPDKKPAIKVSRIYADKQAFEGDAVAFSLPKDFFDEAGFGDDLSFSASLKNGDPLPDWLFFDNQECEFSGIPPIKAVGVYEIVVKATNIDNKKAYTEFLLKIDRAYRERYVTKGTKSGAIVRVLEKCKTPGCADNKGYRKVRKTPGKVFVKPIPY